MTLPVAARRSLMEGKTMRFDPPHRGQEQTVTAWYARTPDGRQALRRTYDASSRTTVYDVADLGDDDDPWLMEPCIVGDWRPITAEEVAALSDG